MRPRFPQFDLGYGRFLESVVIADHLERAGIGSYLWYLFLSDLCMEVVGSKRMAGRMLKSAKPGRSSLAYSVHSVVGLCAEKQMVRSNATPYVAGVAHAKTDRNIAVLKLPRKAMDFERTPDDAVPVIIKTAKPYFATAFWNALAAFFKNDAIVRSWFCHDTSTKVIDFFAGKVCCGRPALIGACPGE